MARSATRCWCGPATCYDLGTEGLPTALHDRQVASGFTHFQQSGTGAIRKYYNYVRVTPMLRPLDDPTRRSGAQTPIRAGPSTLRTPDRASDALRRAGRRHRPAFTAVDGAR